MIPYYIPIPADDRGANLTGAEFVGLIILFAWVLAMILIFDQLNFDDNKQDKKRHKIELIVFVLIAIGMAGVIWLITC